jgi:hypothetical protein
VRLAQAPFADYTTQPEEWETYRALWLAGFHDVTLPVPALAR